MATETIAAELPPLSASDFEAYNRLSVKMASFHKYLSEGWDHLWNVCRPDNKYGYSPRSIINLGLEFVTHLTMHHDMEETHIFPVLAKRMPEFKPNAPHLQQHMQIHKGTDELEQYLHECRDGPRKLKRDRVRECMAKWADVLWTHLDEEVQTLGALNMRRYWSLEEMRMLPM